jgi:hypothetical protein
MAPLAIARQLRVFIGSLNKEATNFNVSFLLLSA